MSCRYELSNPKVSIFARRTALAKRRYLSLAATPPTGTNPCIKELSGKLLLCSERERMKLYGDVADGDSNGGNDTTANSGTDQSPNLPLWDSYD